MLPAPPPLSVFTKAERRLIRRLPTPEAVQRFLNRLPYNTERQRETLRSFRQTVRHGRAHCAESAIFAATVLEQHGYPPLILSIESIDYLDHVIFLYRRNGRWGTIARSRDPGLHGRKPVFRSVRALAASYIDEYVDATGCVQGFAYVDLRRFVAIDWRFSRKNLWALERVLTKTRHRRIKVPRKRLLDMRARYLAYREKHGGRKPLFYRGRKNWTAIPKQFHRPTNETRRRRRRHRRVVGSRLRNMGHTARTRDRGTPPKRRLKRRTGKL